MAVWTTEVNNDYNLPNITVYNVLADGVLMRYRLIPNEGYVMYNTTMHEMEFPQEGEPYEVIYYYRSYDAPLSQANSFDIWVAVLESEVDENYIFGVDDKEEVM